MGVRQSCVRKSELKSQVLSKLSIAVIKSNISYGVMMCWSVIKECQISWSYLVCKDRILELHMGNGDNKVETEWGKIISTSSIYKHFKYRRFAQQSGVNMTSLLNCFQNPKRFIELIRQVVVVYCLWKMIYEPNYFHVFCKCSLCFNCIFVFWIFIPPSTDLCIYESVFKDLELIASEKYSYYGSC